VPHLKDGSSIINCSSVNHYIGRPDLLDYTATKGAIVAFTRALSNQKIHNGIRVNCVCPGPSKCESSSSEISSWLMQGILKVWTPLIPSTMDTKAMEQFSNVPMGRPGQPSEVATCFVFLASQDSSYISGQCLHPNGGVVVGA
jgi:NAD(P)-dependent dehydrogenase (short-subunit alcohol dehydrogenase family)